MWTIQIKPYKTFYKINKNFEIKVFLTHFTRNDPAPYPLNNSKDRSFWCFQRVQGGKSGVKRVKNNIKAKNKFVEFLKWNLDSVGIAYIAYKGNSLVVIF